MSCDAEFKTPPVCCRRHFLLFQASRGPVRTVLKCNAGARFSRKDYAAAAVTVLTRVGHKNKVYELAGDHSYTPTELASELAKQSGKSIVYTNLSPEAWQAYFSGIR